MQRFAKGAGKNELTFPITREQLRNLKPCDLASPRVGKNHGMDLPPELSNDARLLESAQEAYAVRQLAIAGEWPKKAFEEYYPGDWGAAPTVMPKALAGQGLSFDEPLGLADVVHMDQPDDLGRVFRDWLLSQGCVHKDANLDCNDFLVNIPQTNAEMAAAAAAALRKAFDQKNWFGIPRPEEVMNGETHYPEGSPPHPAYPQGHHAAAVAVIFNLLENWRMVEDGKKVPLPDWIEKEGHDCAYVWQFGRVIAWVHYLVDGLPHFPRRSEV